MGNSMNTFYNNLIAAGAKSRKCPNGIAVELYGNLWVFTNTPKPMGLWGDGEIGYVSVPLSTKRAVVIVEKESIAWGKRHIVRSTIPLDGSKYKVFV